MASSPWGTIQHSESLARGIRVVSTAGHGGAMLSPGMNAKIHEAWRRADGNYEEDVDIAIVGYTFGFFDQESVVKTLKNWLPDEYEIVTGYKVAMEDSHVLRERAFRAATVDKYVVRAAWGSWEDTVPNGFVGVVARRESDGDEKAFLVEDGAYQSRTSSYVCTGDEPEWMRHGLPYRGTLEVSE